MKGKVYNEKYVIKKNLRISVLVVLSGGMEGSINLFTMFGFQRF